MHPLSRQILESLWRRADGADLKSSARSPTLTFTSASLPDYHRLPTASDRENVHADLRLAATAGAITIDWDKRARGLQITRIRLVDLAPLGALLGRASSSDRIEEARVILAPYMEMPGVTELIDAWCRGAAPKRLSLDRLGEVADSCKLVSALAHEPGLPMSLRRASARILGDSKRAERLAGAIDAVTNGVAGPSLSDAEIFDRIGLLQFPQPMLFSGRARITVATGGDIDCSSPYLGVPPGVVRGISGNPSFVLTIENLTVFHELATGGGGTNDGLLIYTAGHTGQSWRNAYAIVIGALSVPAYHWGDSDVGGFVIADGLAQVCEDAGRQLRLWRMGDFLPGESNRPLKPADLTRIRSIAERRDWLSNIEALEACQAGIEQELQSLSLPPALS